MEAIVRVAGIQARVAPGDRVVLPRLEAEVGSTMTFDDVLLVSDGDRVTIGTPLVDGARVEAEVLEHASDRKLIVFKKKRRKRYRRTRGHRQRYTAVKITEVLGPENPNPERSQRLADQPAPAEQAAPAAQEDAVQGEATSAETAKPAAEQAE